MKKFLTGLHICCFLALLLAGCFRADKQPHLVKVPQMNNTATADYIVAALTKVEGIKEIDVNLADHQLTVIFDSTKLARKNIEFNLAKLGFQANEWPADKVAREKLPPQFSDQQ